MVSSIQVPATYDDLLQGTGAASGLAGPGLTQEYSSTSNVPASYTDLLRGAGLPQSPGAAPTEESQRWLLNRLASLEQELFQETAVMNAHQSSMRALSPPPAVVSQAHGGGAGELHDLRLAYNQLLKSHTELVSAHTAVVTRQQPATNSHDVASPAIAEGMRGLGPPTQAEVSSRIGIVRLDGPLYNDPDDAITGVIGGVDNTVHLCKSLFYQRVEGLTFDVCQAGFEDAAAASPAFTKEGVVKIKGKLRDADHMFVASRRRGPWNAPRPRRPTRTEALLDESGAEIGVQYIYDSGLMLTYFKEALQLLEEECNVNCISGACGFMGNVQQFCAANSKVPCLMSPLNLLPMVDMMTPTDSYIMILTTCSATFSNRYDELIKPHWNIPKDSRICLVGLQDTDAFGPEAVAGSVVNCKQSAESVEVAVSKAIEDAKPKEIGAILSECTELPGYTNTLRQRFQCPVYDAITVCNILINSRAPREQYDLDASYG